MKTQIALQPKATKTSSKKGQPVIKFPLDGQTRVVIVHVSPELDHGKYAVKAVPGDTITVDATIFADGHDVLSARLLVKHTTGSVWDEYPMTLSYNDRWRGQFTVDMPGGYQYTIEAWVDHTASWQHEIELKVNAGQRITSELLAGALLVDGMAHRAGRVFGNAADEAELFRVAELFRAGAASAGAASAGAASAGAASAGAASAGAVSTGAASDDDALYTEAVHLAQSEQFTQWLNQYPERQHATRYTPGLRVMVDRERAGFSTWYCLFPRSAADETDNGVPRHGTFRDVEKLLPRIAGMGFDVLYLPPIHPIGTAHRKGKNNSVTVQPGEPGVPYGIGSELGGHDAIHPELGTVEDFRHLIAIAKNYDMEVAMDLAIQCSPDHPWAKDHPDWFKKRPDGTIQYAENPPKKYQDIYPVYFETADWQNLWLELRRVLLVWADWGVRIIRVDNPHTKPFAFWHWVIAEVKKEFPDMLFLAEAFTKPNVMQELAKLGFAQSYTYFSWRNSKAELEEYMRELTLTNDRPDAMPYYFRPNFWPTTHDINPPSLQTGHEPQFLIRFFLAATLSSNYGIYGPSFELMEYEPFPGKEEFLNSEKYEIRHWDWAKTNKLTYLITLVNRIRKENRALQTTTNLTLCTVNDDAIMAYLKVSANNRLLIVVNTDAYGRRAGLVQVPIWQLGIAAGQDYIVRDLLTGASYTWRDEWNYVELDPYVLPMHLFRIDL